MRWIALLRAVNLGARNKVPMAELRARLEEAGYGDVRTYLASGNVLLEGAEDATAVAAAVERLILEAFGVATTAVLRTAAELASVVSGHPFGDDATHTHVAFLAAEPSGEAAGRLAAADRDHDEVLLSGTHVYLRYPAGVQRARIPAARLERLLGVAATLRNWRTAAALADLARSGRTT